MKRLILLAFFSFFFTFSYAQEKHPVYVSSWVNVPSQEKFSKSLIFVDFWATWCGPCIQSMPHTDLLAKEFEEDVLFFYVSDEPSMKVEKFMVDRNKSFFSAVENIGHNVENFNIYALPHSVLLDNKGNVIWKGSPTDMNSNLLKQFVKQYKKQQGEKSRIFKLSRAETEDTKWNIFRTSLGQILYLDNQDVANEYTIDKKQYFISGTIKYFVSVIKGVPSYQVFSDTKDDTKYTLTYKAKSEQAFKDMLKLFLKKKAKVDIQRKSKKQKVYVLEISNHKAFFKTDTYDFEKGDNIYLADGLSLMIDNATIKEMVSALSEFSEHPFIYKGSDKNKYDWKVHYKYSDFTFDQLRSELGFKVTEKQKKVNLYYITE